MNTSTTIETTGRREDLGRLVHLTALDWTKANLPERFAYRSWDQLSKDERELDRVIGVRLYEEGCYSVVTNQVTDEIRRLEAVLHSKGLHPDYEYGLTTSAYKGGTCATMHGDGWEINVHAGKAGHASLECHDETYWMRKKDLLKTLSDVVAVVKGDARVTPSTVGATELHFNIPASFMTEIAAQLDKAINPQVRWNESMDEMRREATSIRMTNLAIVRKKLDQYLPF